MCPDPANIEETYENVKLTNLIDDFFVSDYEFSAPPSEANSPDAWINPKEHPKLIYFIDSFLKYMKDLFDCVYTNKKKKKKKQKPKLIKYYILSDLLRIQLICFVKK